MKYIQTILMASCSIGFLLQGLSGVAIASPMAPSSWTQWGSGAWSRTSDQATVTQTVNGSQTYLVSTATYGNTHFEGKLRVTANGDDDYIGLVFGATGNTDFFLFDWKMGYQSGAQEGFTLSRISGSSVNYWYHSGSDIQVLATDYGPSTGWEYNTGYTITLDYTTTGIAIAIDGTSIFSLTGMNNNPDGHFGFYNYSQTQATYQGFVQDRIRTNRAPAPVPEPATILLFGTGLLGLAFFSRKRIQK